MQPKHLEAMRQGVEQTMNENLTFARATGKTLPYEYLYYTEYKNKTLKFDEQSADAITEFANKIHELQDAGIELQATGDTRNVGRYDYAESWIVRWEETKLVSEISHNAVKKEMHRRLKPKMGVDKYKELDCKVLMMFREGLIDWEECKIMTKRNCEV